MGPAAGEASSGRLEKALLSPKDLGAEFSRHSQRNQDPTQYDMVSRSKKCTKAVKGIVPLYRARAATWLRRGNGWEGVSEYLLGGGRDRISALERAAETMVRDCSGVKVVTKASQDTIQKLPVGRLGDAAYGIRLRSGFPGENLEDESMVAIDIVIIRAGNTILVLEHDGHAGQFDPKLTGSAARAAIKKLLKTQRAS